MEETFKIDGVDEEVSLKSKHVYACSHNQNMYIIVVYHGVSGNIYKRVSNHCRFCHQDKLNLRRSYENLDFQRMVTGIKKKAREKKYLTHNHTHESA